MSATERDKMPFELHELDDYVSGQMSDEASARFEEALFSAAAQGDDAPEPAAALVAFFDRLARNAAWLNHHGFGFRGGSTRREVDQILASGKGVHYLELGDGGVNVLDLWPTGTQIVITRFGVDLRGYRDVQIEMTLPEGPVVKTFLDCEYDPSDGALYAVCHEPLARLAFQHPHVIARVSGIKGASRETVAVYEARPRQMIRSP